MPSEGGAGPMDDFDRIEQVTRRVGRSAAVGIPVLVLALALLPFTGLGPLACLSLAVLLAVGAVVVVERRRARRGAAGTGPAGRASRGPMSPATAAALTLGAVALLAYVVFVIRAA